MGIQDFMEGYKAAWEKRDPLAFASLFHVDGHYHNTPFQVQHGKAELVEYWKRVQLQEDIHVNFEVLASGPDFSVAHWNVTYQVASEELFEIWARSTGTSQHVRDPGETLPRMMLDGVLVAKFVEDHCMEARIWWHSMPQPT